MVDFLVRLEAAVGKLLLVVIVVLVFAAGVLRWFDHPLIWSVDLAQLLFLWIAFIGANQALRKRVHIGMDLAVRWMPLAWRRVIEIALAALTLAFLLIMVWEGYKLTTLNIQRVFGDSGIQLRLRHRRRAGRLPHAGDHAHRPSGETRPHLADGAQPRLLRSAPRRSGRPAVTLLSLTFLVLMLAGLPIAFAIGMAGFTFFLTNGTIPVSIGVQQVATASQSFPLLAVPFFLLAGHMMNHSGITSRLINCSNVLVSWMAGGLAQVCIVLSTLMGGVSGAAVADAAMEARILGPELIKAGYSKGFASAVIAVGSLITSTIPPSIGLILYGFVGNVSIGRLFLAGVVPGLLMMTFLMATTWFIARRRNYRSEMATRPTLKAVGKAVADAKWALLFPLALLIAIRGGLFTPSEVGAFAVVYAAVVGVVAHREMTWSGLLEALGQAVTDIGMIMLIIVFSGMVGYAIIFEQAPQEIAAALIHLTTNPLAIVALLLLFVFVAGLFVESTVLVLLLTPIFLPIVRPLGVDEVHFGILMMTIVTLGSMTPPVGVCMYTVCSLLDTPVEEYVVESIPFVLAVLVEVALLAFFPQVVLFLPNLVM